MAYVPGGKINTSFVRFGLFIYLKQVVLFYVVLILPLLNYVETPPERPEVGPAAIMGLPEEKPLPMAPPLSMYSDSSAKNFVPLHETMPISANLDGYALLWFFSPYKKSSYLQN